MAAIIRQILLTVFVIVVSTFPVAADTLFGKSPEVPAVPNGITDVGIIILRLDADRDGIDDDWERLYGLDPTNPLDSFLDHDGDGLQAVQEYQAGTNPLNPDTDGDGATDSEELAFGTNPLDSASKPSSAIVSIAIVPSSIHLIMNPIIVQASRQLKVLATMEDGTVTDITASARGTLYSSDNTSVATVTAEGLVIAVLAEPQQSGTATITAVNSGQTAVATVNVTRFSPTPISRLSLGAQLNDLDASGNRLYVAAKIHGVHVVDITFPSSPVHLTTVAGGDARDVKVSGNLVYVANGSNNMRIIDRQTFAWDEVEGTTGAVDLAVNSRYVFLACGSQGLKIVDRNTLQVFTPGIPELQAGINNVDANENQAIVQKNSGTVLVLDITNINQIILRGSFGPLTQPIQDLLLSGALAFVANDIDGIQILNIANPEQPVLISTARIEGQSVPGGMLSNDLSLLGNFLFTSDIFYINALPIFNVSNPSSPALAAIIDFTSVYDDANGLGVDVEGEYVYLCTSDFTIQVAQYIKYNESGTAGPTVQILSPIPGSTAVAGHNLSILIQATDDVAVDSVDILVNGDVVFTDTAYPYQFTYLVPSGLESLTIGAKATDRAGNEASAPDLVVNVVPDTPPLVNITSPLNGADIQEGTTFAVSVSVSDDFSVQKVELYVNNVIKAQDFTSPYTFGYTVPYGTSGSTITFQAKATDSINQVSVSPEVVINVTDDTAPVVTITAPANGAVVDEGVILPIIFTAVDNVAVTTAYLYADGKLLKQYFTPSPYQFNYLVPYGASTSIMITAKARDNKNQEGYATPIVFNVNDIPSGPSRISELALPVSSTDVAVSGNYAFISVGSSGVLVVDITNLQAPFIATSIDTPGYAYELKVQANYAYVADGTGGLQVIDISSPESPQIVSSVAVTGEALAVAVSGNTTFVAGSSSVTSVDISNPTAPAVLDELNTGRHISIDVSGNFAVIGNPQSGPSGIGKDFSVVDISDPSNLTRPGNLSRGSIDLATKNQIAYSVNSSLDIIDFSMPGNLQLLGTLTVTGQGIGVVTTSDNLALLGINDGIGIVDITNEASPVLQSLLSFGPDYSAGNGIATQDDFVFKTANSLIDGTGKLFIARFRTPEDTAGIEPTVTITSPTSGSTANEGSLLEVSIDASDDVGISTVELLLDGAVIANDFVAPYEMSLTVPNGVSQITLGAQATDFGGNVGVATDVTVTVIGPDLIPPSVSITSPADGTIADVGTNITVVANATDNVAIDSVEFLVNGTIAFTDSTTPYEFNLTLPNQPGDVILTAHACDTSGNCALSPAVTISVCGITTITGRTIDIPGNPVQNIKILLFGEEIAVTDVSGNFAAFNQSVCVNSLEVVAVDWSEQIIGRSVLTTVVVNGTTDVGDIIVTSLGLPLYPGPEFPVGDLPNHAAVADLNGDSKLDIVVANFGTDDISVLLGNGAGLFLPEQRYDAGAIPTSVVIQDFNGDSYLDIITSNVASNDISILLGNGDGTFDPEQRYSAGNGTWWVAAGDFNEDGDQDIVTANADSDTVSVLLGNGDGSFQTQQSYGVGDGPVSVATADLNGDGDLDVVTANRGCRFAEEGEPCDSATDVSVLFGNGDGTLQTEQRFTVGDGPFSVTTGDLNADGNPEILTANENSDDISLLLSQGGGAFAPQQTYAVGDFPDSVVVADLTGDGNADVITSNAGSSDVSVLAGDGTGALAPQQRFPTGLDPASVTVAELNGDSRLDAVVTNFDVQTIVILFGNTAIFDTQRLIPSGDEGSQPNSLFTSDLDEDGNLDLIYDHFGFGEIVIRTGNGNGTFNNPTIIDVGDNGTVSNLVTEDFNSDDHVDLAWGDLATGEVVVRLGNGDASFGNEIRSGVSSAPCDVTEGDFNNDSILDLVTANCFFSNDVSVLIGNGDGSFQAPVLYSTGVYPATAVVGDVNNDSVSDIVVSNLNSNDVSILINNGDGTFETEQRITVGTTPAEVVVADFDGDNDLDLATTNFGSENISIRLGNGDGTFGSLKNFATEASPGFLRSADLNGDTFIDLIAGGENHEFIMILAGYGNGNFAPVQRYNTGNTPTSTSISDLNGDGELDLVTTNFYSDNISILLHR